LENLPVIKFAYNAYEMGCGCHFCELENELETKPNVHLRLFYHKKYRCENIFFVMKNVWNLAIKR